MMLLPQLRKETVAIEWQQVLDFAQIGVVALTAYLYFFYVPSRWEAEGPQMVLRLIRLQLFRDLALSSGFLIRASTIAKGSIRALFGRMTGLFVVASISDLFFLLAPYTSRAGARWTDITWCMPYLFAVFIATTWNREEESLPLEVSSRFRAIVVSQILPILIPLLVLFMGRRIAAEQIAIAWIAITTSFILSAARLILTSEKQRRLAEDILETEQALRASEERFRNLVQDLHVGVVLLGPNAETKFANQAALETFGLSQDEAHGKSTSSFSMVAIREDGTEIPFAMRPGPRAIATKQPVRNEMVGWRRANSNEVFWTLVDAVPHLTPEGEVANVILSISNITQRKEAEEALRASEERFRTLVRDFHVGVILLGPDAEIQFANQAAQQMFGISLEEAKGKNSSQLDVISIREDGTEIPFSMRPGPRAIQARRPIQNEVMGWRRPDSSEVLWTLGNATPQFAPDGSVSAVINTFTNITERKQAEEALHQLSTRLLQLQDEERRRLGRELHDSLAQSVLAVNLNLAQATRSLTSLDDRSRHALAEARRVLAEMSREIRTLSYLLHPPLLDELGLVSAVKEYAEGFGERSGITLEFDVQAGFGRLPQEAETALFRIVQESLANIQKHSGTQTAKIHLRCDSASVNLEVIDRGRGMDQKAIERGNGSGTRLGVGILGMRERITQLGGKLEIESSSSGTTVRVSIPLRTEVSDDGSHPRSR
jgi:PAS domain S-box-containing protein